MTKKADSNRISIDSSSADLIIPRSDHASYQQNWQVDLKSTIRSVDELLEWVGVNPSDLPWSILTDHKFALRVPRSFLQCIEYGRADDPLLLQILPLALENTNSSGFTSDPLDEANSTPVAGLLHKYHGRVLLIITAACAIHCRYCFRKTFPYSNHRHNADAWQGALDYITNNETVEEVILSGGDPLVLTDAELLSRIADIELIPHVTTLRIHSRLAALLPHRFTDELVSAFAASRLSVVLVMHCNHPNELQLERMQEPIIKLRGAGVLLLNQAVLLRRVNDNIDALTQLSKQLFHLGVQPYYLHLLDRVQGTAHFEVNQAEALDLYNQLMRRLPGYLVPKLVRESPEVAFKLPLIQGSNV